MTNEFTPPPPSNYTTVMVLRNDLELVSEPCMPENFAALHNSNTEKLLTLGTTVGGVTILSERKQGQHAATKLAPYPGEACPYPGEACPYPGEACPYPGEACLRHTKSSRYRKCSMLHVSQHHTRSLPSTKQRTTNEIRKLPAKALLVKIAGVDHRPQHPQTKES